MARKTCKRPDDDLGRLLNDIDVFVERSGVGPTTISQALFNDGKRLKLLQDDKGSITVRTLRRARRALDKFIKDWDREAAKTGQAA